MRARKLPAASPPRPHSAKSALRTGLASLRRQPSPSTARANDLATGCKPLRSPCPPATLRTSHRLLQFPVLCRGLRFIQIPGSERGNFAQRALLHSWNHFACRNRRRTQHAPLYFFLIRHRSTSFPRARTIFPRTYLTFAVSFVRLLPFLPWRIRSCAVSRSS